MASRPTKPINRPIQPTIQPLSGISPDGHRAANGDADQRQHRNISQDLEVEREGQDQRDETDQQDDADPAADERRANRHAERLAAFALLGELHDLRWHGRHGVGCAGNVDQHGGDGTAEDASRCRRRA